uniref:HAT C-terminal dimerisation domain-containing protein n=1 Tax=Romanomermis culicivorax TaxID=13658 RepID=A0A915HJN6_ROMCU
MKLREKVELEIQTFIYNGVSFMTHIWSNLTESLLSSTLHGINDDFERVQFVLHAQPLSDERHTAENLNHYFEEMLENWNIDKMKELEAYKSMKKPSSDDCELQWWKTNKNTFPLLSKVAKLFLSPPSTSIASERLISNAVAKIVEF